MKAWTWITQTLRSRLNHPLQSISPRQWWIYPEKAEAGVEQCFHPLNKSLLVTWPIAKSVDSTFLATQCIFYHHDSQNHVLYHITTCTTFPISCLISGSWPFYHFVTHIFMPHDTFGRCTNCTIQSKTLDRAPGLKDIRRSALA